MIQNTQNRDSHAVQLKLDELIRAVSGAHNALLDLERRVRYEEFARAAREALGRGELDIGTPGSQAGLDHAAALTGLGNLGQTASHVSSA